MHSTEILTLFFTIIGLSIGSFINAFSWRYKINHSVSSKKKNKDLSILTGRSMCPNCRHILGPMDLIPIISWILLRGKCRYCHQKISFQYPLVEFITGLLSLIYYIEWTVLSSYSSYIIFALVLLILYGLIILALYDIKWYILPTQIIYFLFSLGIIYQILNIKFGTNPSSLIEIVLGTIIGGGIFYLLYVISSGRWIGGGDVRLGFLLGFLLGSLTNSILLIFFASVIGTIISLLLILFKRTTIKSMIPFGPFLIVSYVIIQLFSRTIIAWASKHYLIF